MDIRSIVFYNSEVHKLLEDNPGREQLLNKLSAINSLEKWNKNISYYITNKDEFRNLENLVNLIHENTLESYNNVFYVEIPIELYNWLKKSSFPEIIKQISSYFAFLLLEDSSRNKRRPVLIDNFFNIIKPQIHQTKKEISKTKLSYADLKKYLPIFKKYHPKIYYLDRELIYRLFKYWSYFEKTFDCLPPMHFISSYKLNEEIVYIDYKLYNLIIIEYGSIKEYYGINSNRWDKLPNEFEYSDAHLNMWKDIYRENLKQESNFFDEKVKIINTSYRYNLKELLRCQLCYSDLEFEAKSGMKIPDNHPLLCSSCYLEEYFEKLYVQENKE